jgi:hypothetical protein
MVLKYKVWIRLCIAQNLILSFCLTGCFKNTDSRPGIAIQWNDSVATGLIIPLPLVSSVPNDSIKDFLQVHLIRDSFQPSVFGEYSISPDAVIFQPLIPFTRGLGYEVRFKNRSLGRIEIPPADSSLGPEVMAVYPGQDTLPENLLKIYIQFSKPMQEADPLRYFQLVKNGRDTVREVFLDLRPALWNKEGTLLTLWLDPGRIKRDLQPNKNMGAPLQEGESCQLLIEKDWPAKNGATLLESFTKKFTVTSRDSLSPDPGLWKIEVPQAATQVPLKIEFREPLDYVLLEEAIDVMDDQGKRVDGEFKITDEETVLHFIPAGEWQVGSYAVQCESRLEDLAGNNLNRLFDRDIAGQRADAEKEFFKIEFRIP